MHGANETFSVQHSFSLGGNLTTCAICVLQNDGYKYTFPFPYVNAEYKDLFVYLHRMCQNKGALSSRKVKQFYYSHATPIVDITEQCI